VVHSNKAQRPGIGVFILEESRYSRLNKNSFSENSETVPNEDKRRPFRVHFMFGMHFIVLDDAVQPQENEWFTMERLPSGKIVFEPKVLGQ
jgi:hypothetical protein